MERSGDADEVSVRLRGKRSRPGRTPRAACRFKKGNAYGMVSKSENRQEVGTGFRSCAGSDAWPGDYSPDRDCEDEQVRRESFGKLDGQRGRDRPGKHGCFSVSSP